MAAMMEAVAERMERVAAVGRIYRMPLRLRIVLHQLGRSPPDLEEQRRCNSNHRIQGG